MPLRHRLDVAVLFLLLAVFGATLGVYAFGGDFFWRVYAAEDGIVEYGTAVFLLLASLVLVANSTVFLRHGRRGAAVLTVLYGLLFFFAAGEEVSWGQRIFGWASGDFFEQNNYQDETNLHNLTVAGIDLSKTLFGPVLTLVILLYLVVLPIGYARLACVRRLADRFAVPVPRPRHAVLALLASLLIAAIDVARKWEVYELIFAMLATSIFLRPGNRDKTV